MNDLGPIRPYTRLLLINGVMAISFLLLYFTGTALSSMGIMVLAILFACLCFVVELMLSVLAVVRGQLLMAAAYGLLSLALFFADSWLLKQAE